MIDHSYGNCLFSHLPLESGLNDLQKTLYLTEKDLVRQALLTHLPTFPTLSVKFSTWGALGVSAAAAAAAKSLQSCPTLWDPIDQPTRLPRPWDSPGKNTGVGCHFLLQSMKVKSEREFAQSGPTLSDPMDCSLPGSSVHGIFQARVLEWGAIAFSAWSLYRRLIATPHLRVA